MRAPERLIAVFWAVMAVVAVVVSFPAVGELIFRGYFVQDADEVIRAWYGRCAWRNPNIIPYSHLSMPGWTAVLALSEGLGRVLGLPLTLVSRLVTVAAAGMCLRGVAGFVRAAGGSEKHALVAVAMTAATPGFFLLSLSVYPSIAFAALAIAACQRWCEGRHRAAAAIIGWTPLIRWEGALLVALFAVFVVAHRRWRALGWLVAPYLAYLALNAVRFGNPWTPLVYRTTKHMGAWLVFNPGVPAERLADAWANLVAFFTPAVLVAGLPLAAWAALRHLRAMGPAPLAFGGLAVTLLSIQHDFIVYALRVFATPLVLGIATMVALAARVGGTAGRAVLGLVVAGTLVSAGMGFTKVNEASVPAPGRARSEVGFHPLVRSADATDVLEWLREAPAEWVVVNHLNANLLRADPTCSLYDLPLRIGGPRMSLGYDFRPGFALPEGTGLVVFHALPLGVEGCTLVLSDPETHQQIYRCK